MRLSCLVSVSALVFGSGAAFAGGIVAPVVEVAPVVVAPVATIAPAWGGAYVGGSLGYIFDTEDQVGLAGSQDGLPVGSANDIGDVGVSGATAGVHVGYRWQRGSWVFGPELGVEGGSVDETITGTAFGIDGRVESEMKNIVTLVMKTGYAMNAQTLVYGTFGVARGDFDYTLEGLDDSITEGFTATGLAAGLGVERVVGARTSVFAEYQYRDFGNEDVAFDTIVGGGTTFVSVASTSMSTVKIGANFRF